MATLGGLPPDLLARLGQFSDENRMALLGGSMQLLGGGGFQGAGNAMMLGSKVDQSNRYLKQEQADKKKKEEQAAAQRAALEAALGPDLVKQLGPDTASELVKAQQIFKMKPKEPEYRQVGEDLVRISGDQVQPIYKGGPKVTDRQRDLMAAGMDPTSPEGRQALIGNKQYSPYEVEQQKAKAETEKERQTNAEGAQGFLDKVNRLEKLIGEGGKDAFGPVQGSSLNRSAGAFFGTGTERTRQQIDAVLKDLELDVAKMKLKGQGTVTETERRIAKETLPTLQTMDPQTALQILSGLKQEASGVLQRGGGQQQQGAAAPQQRPDPLGIR